MRKYGRKQSRGKAVLEALAPSVKKYVQKHPEASPEEVYKKLKPKFAGLLKESAGSAATSKTAPKSAGSKKSAGSAKAEGKAIRGNAVLEALAPSVKKYVQSHPEASPEEVYRKMKPKLAGLLKEAKEDGAVAISPSRSR